MSKRTTYLPNSLSSSGTRIDNVNRPTSAELREREITPRSDRAIRRAHRAIARWERENIDKFFLTDAEMESEEKYLEGLSDADRNIAWDAGLRCIDCNRRFSTAVEHEALVYRDKYEEGMYCYYCYKSKVQLGQLGRILENHCDSDEWRWRMMSLDGTQIFEGDECGDGYLAEFREKCLGSSGPTDEDIIMEWENKKDGTGGEYWAPAGLDCLTEWFLRHHYGMEEAAAKAKAAVLVEEKKRLKKRLMERLLGELDDEE